MNLLRFRHGTSWMSAVSLLALAVTAAAQSYSVTDLGPTGGNPSGARGINAGGQITGYAYSSSTKSNVFLYTGGKMRVLGTLGGTTGIGLAVNTSGRVAGYSTLSNGNYRAFISSGAKLTTVGTLAGSYSDAEGINDAGQVTGASSAANGGDSPLPLHQRETDGPRDAGWAQFRILEYRRGRQHLGRGRGLVLQRPR